MIKEIPILFSTPMVLAIQDGRKTMTRRGSGLDKINKGPNLYDFINLVCNPKGELHAHFWHKKKDSPLFIKSPYGNPGDLLYVRETHYRFGHWEPIPGKTKKNGKPKYRFVADTIGVLFDAPAVFRKGMHNADPEWVGWYKRNSLFMPKEAARIWLQVEDESVERLQDISDSDSLSEGITILGDSWIEKHFPEYHEKWVQWRQREDWDEQKPPIGPSPRQRFQTLWQSINGPESWDANTWAWVVKFKVLSTTGKPK